MGKTGVTSFLSTTLARFNKMHISETQAYSTLEAHLILMWEAVQAAHTRLRRSPDLTDMSPRGIATYENDLIFAELIKHFDEVPEVKIVEERNKNLRFISIKDKILLWPKKVDSARHKSNYLTDHAQEMIDGQYELQGIEEAAVVVLGYYVNPHEDEVRRLSFSPPFDKKPEWYFDVAIPGATEMTPKTGKNPPAQPKGKLKLTIIRGAKQGKLLS